MSTGIEPVAPSGTSAQGGTSASQVPSGGTQAANQPPSEYRYPNDPSVEPWARGKTATEILNITRQQNDVIRNYIATGQQQQQPVQQPQPYTNQYGSYIPPAQQQDQGFNQTEYVTGADIQRLAPKMIQDAISPQLQPIVEMTAQGNLAHVQREDAAFFQKYGAEINMALAGVDKRLWTVDNLRKAVKFVKADHLDELGREIADQRIAGMGAELRSNGSPTPQVAQSEPQYTLKSDILTEDFKKRAAEKGLTDRDVADFCRANDMTVEDWYKLYGKTVITEVARG